MRHLRFAMIGQSIAWLLVMSATAHGFDCLSANGASVPCPGPRWANSGATLQSSLGTPWDQDALNSANEWTAVGTAFHYTVQIVPGGPINDPCSSAFCPNASGDNPVFFATSVCGQGFGDVVAQTNNCWNPNTNNMINAPVFVNSSVPWNAYDGPLQPPVNDIRRVLLHEFGHVLGLGHPDQLKPLPQNVTAIMNSGESDIYTLQPDDIAGIASLYPNGSTAGGPNGPLPSIGCQTTPGSASDAWTLALPALLLTLQRRRRCRKEGAACRASKLTADR
ncbi:MAG: matrixin family metalloprotease [Candidatus Binatia bacterium]